MSVVLTTPSDRIGPRLEAWLLVEDDDESTRQTYGALTADERHNGVDRVERLLERVERFLERRAQ